MGGNFIESYNNNNQESEMRAHGKYVEVANKGEQQSPNVQSVVNLAQLDPVKQ